MNTKNCAEFFFLPHRCANFAVKFVQNTVMKKISLILVVLLSSLFSMSAQKPIKWRSNVKMTSETEGVVTIKAIIEPGWHLYGMQIPSGGPKATKIDLTSSEGVKFVGNITPSIAPKKVYDKTFDLNLNWWDQNVTFTQKFKVTSKKSAKIVGVISYMGCNDQTCSPPSTQSINIVVPSFKK